MGAPFPSHEASLAPTKNSRCALSLNFLGSRGEEKALSWEPRTRLNSDCLSPLWACSSGEQRGVQAYCRGAEGLLST